MTIHSGDPENLGTLLRVESIRPGLRSQVLRPGRGAQAGFGHVLLLEMGEAQIAHSGEAFEVEGSAGVILPATAELVITLGPGCSGWTLGFSPELLANAIGTGPEAGLLAPAGLNLIIARGFIPRTRPLPGDLIAAIRHELDLGAPGGYLAVVACLRLILLSVWRESRIEVSAPGHRSDLHLIEGFRRVVEVHFRAHKRIADYTEMLGITESRLRRICQRNTGHSPLALIHLRMMREATTWLERSGQPIAEIAQELGFADSAEFSHFFKRHSQLSPRQYRSALRRRSPEEAAPLLSFADWP